MKTNKQIFLELKQVLKNTKYKISYRNRNGKEYITVTQPWIVTKDQWGITRTPSYQDFNKIIRTAFPVCQSTSGSSTQMTFRINP